MTTEMGSEPGAGDGSGTGSRSFGRRRACGSVLCASTNAQRGSGDSRAVDKIARLLIRPAKVNERAATRLAIAIVVPVRNASELLVDCLAARNHGCLASAKPSVPRHATLARMHVHTPPNV